MTIYFTHSHRLSSEIENRITEIIGKLGYSLAKRQRPDRLHNLDRKEANKIFDTNVKKLKKSDMVLAEMSFISSGVGYDISLALEEKKPVFVLYNMFHGKNSENHIDEVPLHIKGNTSRGISIKEYDVRNLDKILKTGLKEAKTRINSKFILIIPPDINHYLEWSVKERSMPKAAATREALRFIMKKTEDYQRFLKEGKGY